MAKKKSHTKKRNKRREKNADDFLAIATGLGVAVLLVQGIKK
jgi:hypothetical protein